MLIQEDALACGCSVNIDTIRIHHYTVHLMGGLGNQMFQLAFLEYIQKITGGRAFLADLHGPQTHHSNERYFDTIFREWRAMHDASIQPSATSPLFSTISILDKSPKVSTTNPG